MTSLSLIDIDRDGFNELFVGTEDGCLRVLKNDEIMFEISESAMPIEVENLSNSTFALYFPLNKEFLFPMELSQHTSQHNGFGR